MPKRPGIDDYDSGMTPDEDGIPLPPQLPHTGPDLWRPGQEPRIPAPLAPRQNSEVVGEPSPGNIPGKRPHDRKLS